MTQYSPPVHCFVHCNLKWRDAKQTALPVSFHFLYCSLHQLYFNPGLMIVLPLSLLLISDKPLIKVYSAHISSQSQCKWYWISSPCHVHAFASILLSCSITSLQRAVRQHLSHCRPLPDAILALPHWRESADRWTCVDTNLSWTYTRYNIEQKATRICHVCTMATLR